VGFAAGWQATGLRRGQSACAGGGGGGGGGPGAGAGGARGPQQMIHYKARRVIHHTCVLSKATPHDEASMMYLTLGAG